MMPDRGWRAILDCFVTLDTTETMISFDDITPHTVTDSDVVIRFDGSNHYQPVLLNQRKGAAALGWQTGGVRKIGRTITKIKGVKTYNRYAWKLNWSRKYLWVRKDEDRDLAWCSICPLYVHLRSTSNQLSMGTARLSTMTVSKLSDHAKSHPHQRCMDAHELKLKLQSGRREGVGGFVTITDKHTIICRLIRTVYLICKEDLPVIKLDSLVSMQEANGLAMGSGEYANSQFGWEMVEIIAVYYRKLQTERIVRSRAFSFSGDGSTNVSNSEMEVVEVKYLDRPVDDAMKFVEEFFDMAGVLTEDAGLDDGELSVNSNAVYSTYTASFSKREDPFLLEANWEVALVAVSFDGASVMLGKESSVGTKVLEAAPLAQVNHGVAHRLELCAADACQECEFLALLTEIIGNTFAYYHTSPKKSANLRRVATTLESEVSKLVGIHGIRWRASVLRGSEVWLTNFKAMCHDLMSVAMKEIGRELTTLSPAADFLRVKVPILFAEAGRKSTTFVYEVVPGHEEKLRVRFRNGDVMVQTKMEIVTHLADEEQGLLAESRPWQMHVANTQFRVVITMCFNLDVQFELARVSMVFQRALVTPSDIIDTLDSCLSQLYRMRTENGNRLSTFLDEYDSNTCLYKGIPLGDPVEGRVQFDLDRGVILTAMDSYLKARFEGFLSNPVFQATIAFEHRRWSDVPAAALALYGIESIKLLADHYKSYAIMEGFDLRAALHEWECVKRETMGCPFFQKHFVHFWEHLLNHYDSPLRYQNILLLATVAILNFFDTSGCERHIARMNRIHTSSRDRLSVPHCNDLMSADMLGPDIKQFDPKPMLAEWLNGPLGRGTRGRYLRGKLNGLAVS